MTKANKKFKDLTPEEKKFLEKLESNAHYPFQPHINFFFADPETAEAITKEGQEFIQQIQNKMEEIYIIMANIPYEGYETPFRDEYYKNKALAEKVCEELNKNLYGESHVFTLKLRKEL